MNFDIGYHVVARDALNQENMFDAEMSVVEFLRQVEQMGEIPYNVTVHGLDTYLQGAESPEELCSFINRIFSERVNFLLNKNPIVQFVVDDVEFWDEPVIPNDDGDINLNMIFQGSLEPEGPSWHYSRLNITS
ncbi:hypothetical protein [Natronobiforma cellulositropha]|uniref:hypothetical protein n=1 Tax=Natronobiforma cellulositropha TaxID=1679076 RepID=UPI0021D613FE|nr:hypothetical protein [Natronobiforma cellulositropha]